MSRPYYPTKAAWAAARASALRKEADLLPFVRSTDWRGVKARARARDAYWREARRFEQMADRFRADGK